MRPVLIEFNGEKRSITGWAQHLNITKPCLWRRLQNWPLDKAMTQPKKTQRPPAIVVVDDPADLERARRARKSTYDRIRYLKRTCSTAKHFSV
jgi:hypothetical protein